MDWLKRHFERHRQRPPWNFCWRVTVEGVVVSIVLALIMVIPLMALGVRFESRVYMKFTVAERLFVLVVVAPVLETLFLQVIPIGIARLAKARFQVQVYASLIPFAALHFPEGVVVGVAAGVVGGFYLAFNYAHWIEKSFWTALWTTMAAHAMRNALPAVVTMFE